MREPYSVVIESAREIPGRGVLVVGRHSGGKVASGDSARLVDGESSVYVPELLVEPDPPRDKVVLMLYGVSVARAKGGATLIGPIRDGVRRTATESPTTVRASFAAWLAVHPSVSFVFSVVFFGAMAGFGASELDRVGAHEHLWVSTVAVLGGLAVTALFLASDQPEFWRAIDDRWIAPAYLASFLLITLALHGDGWGLPRWIQLPGDAHILGVGAISVVRLLLPVLKGQGLPSQRIPLPDPRHRGGRHRAEQA